MEHHAYCKFYEGSYKFLFSHVLSIKDKMRLSTKDKLLIPYAVINNDNWPSDRDKMVHARETWPVDVDIADNDKVSYPKSASQHQL